MLFSHPYSSQREPVLGTKVVATSQPLAAQAGLDAMRRGGNAVDAAVATAAALTVVEPTANGLGSDAFAILWHEGQLHAINGSGRSPAAWSPQRFSDHTRMPNRGWESVTVPGAVSAWADLSRRFGRLTFEDTLAPAIAYASEGYLVSPQTASGWRRSAKRYGDFPDWMATFAPEGHGPATGEKVRLPDHAKTLRRIAETGGESFYRGHLADEIIAAAAGAGGAMTAEDLNAHRCDQVTPLSMAYGDVQLHEIPPNGQGIAALIALGILAHLPVASAQRDSPASIHLQIESLKAALSSIERHVADPAFMDRDPASMLAPEGLSAAAAAIDHQRASEGGRVAGYTSTVLLCAADDEGTMVSFIQSNYEGFGSGIVVPGCGIAMQNRGAGFTLEEGHPNQVGGGKRPFHTIIPGFLTRGGEPLMAFGVMGGPMQAQGHVQVVIRMIDQDLDPQSALDAPRFQVLGGRRVALEPGFPQKTVAALRAMGHEVTVAPERSVAFGGGQAIWRLEDGYVAGSDLRRDGQAVAL